MIPSVVQEFVAQTRKAGVVLDAGVALLFAVGSYDAQKLGKLKRTEAFVPEDFSLLKRLLALTATQVVVPNVGTEVCNLVGNISEPIRSEVLTVFATTLGSYPEEYVPTRSAVSNIHFLQLELTDAVLVELVLGGFGLITLDSRLYQIAAGVGGSVLNFNHLRPLAWNLSAV